MRDERIRLKTALLEHNRPMALGVYSKEVGTKRLDS